MTTQIAIAFFSFILIILEVLRRNEQANKKGKAIIIVGMLIFAFGLYNIYENNKEKNENQSHIDSILDVGQKSQDSIVVLNNHISILKNRLDSLRSDIHLVGNDINIMGAGIKNNLISIFSQEVIFGIGDKITFNEKFIKGAKISIMNSNCNHNIALFHNDKQDFIKEAEDGSFKTIIEEDGISKGTSLRNTGRRPCGMYIEIYPAGSMNTISFVKSDRSVKGVTTNTLSELSDTVLKDPPIENRDSKKEVCELEKIPMKVIWKMDMEYSYCSKKHPTIDWTALTVFCKVQDFSVNDDNTYNFSAIKYADIHKGKTTPYTREIPIKFGKGYLENCELIIPLKKEDSQKSEGYFKLNRCQSIDNVFYIHGEFQSHTHGCKGKITLTEISS